MTRAPRPPGAFDTDAEALARRIEAHARFGTRDLDAWVLEQLELAPGLRILELGCGTGKQTLPMAEAVGTDGCVVAIDASSDALGTLRSAAVKSNLDDRISMREARFDELPLLEGHYDRVVSCFALYYAQRLEPLFERIDAALAPQGLLFFCGPSERNNAELLRFHAGLGGDLGDDSRHDPVVEFMQQTGPELARSLFADVEQFEFENPLRFDSSSAVLTYWRSYNIYDPALETAFEAAIEEHFRHAPVFVTTKRVRAVCARKRGEVDRPVSAPKP